MMWSNNQGHAELRSCRTLEAMRWCWIVGSNTHLTETSLRGETHPIWHPTDSKVLPDCAIHCKKTLLHFFPLDVSKISTPHYQGSSLFPFVVLLLKKLGFTDNKSVCNLMGTRVVMFPLVLAA